MFFNFPPFVLNLSLRCFHFSFLHYANNKTVILESSLIIVFLRFDKWAIQVEFINLFSTCGGIRTSVLGSTSAILYSSRRVSSAVSVSADRLVGGWGEAELHAVRVLLVRPLDLCVVDQHNCLAGLLDTVKLAQPRNRLVRFCREPLDLAR